MMKPSTVALLEAAPPPRPALLICALLGIPWGAQRRIPDRRLGDGAAVGRRAGGGAQRSAGGGGGSIGGASASAGPRSTSTARTPQFEHAPNLRHRDARGTAAGADLGARRLRHGGRGPVGAHVDVGPDQRLDRRRRRPAHAERARKKCAAPRTSSSRSPSRISRCSAPAGRLNVAESNVASLKAHADDVQVMYDKQAVAQSDVLGAQVALANATQQRLRAANALRLATAAYNRWVGQPLDRDSRARRAVGRRRRRRPQARSISSSRKPSSTAPNSRWSARNRKVSSRRRDPSARKGCRKWCCTRAITMSTMSFSTARTSHRSASGFSGGCSTAGNFTPEPARCTAAPTRRSSASPT